MKMKSFILKYASKIVFYDINIACYQSAAFWSCGSDSATKAPWSGLDRAAIAVRSDCGRGVLPRYFCTVRWTSCKWTIVISRSSRNHDEEQPSDEDQGYGESTWRPSWCNRVMRSRTSYWWVMSPRHATCGTSAVSLKLKFVHVLDWWLCGLGSTRSPPSW